nr:MAG TPA: hypothetical protein [Caudoviricetes sp.]
MLNTPLLFITNFKLRKVKRKTYVHICNRCGQIFAI